MDRVIAEKRVFGKSRRRPGHRGPALAFGLAVIRGVSRVHTSKFRSPRCRAVADEPSRRSWAL